MIWRWWVGWKTVILGQIWVFDWANFAVEMAAWRPLAGGCISHFGRNVREKEESVWSFVDWNTHWTSNRFCINRESNLPTWTPLYPRRQREHDQRAADLRRFEIGKSSPPMCAPFVSPPLFRPLHSLLFSLVADNWNWQWGKWVCQAKRRAIHRIGRSNRIKDRRPVVTSRWF